MYHDTRAPAVGAMATRVRRWLEPCSSVWPFINIITHHMWREEAGLYNV